MGCFVFYSGAEIRISLHIDALPVLLHPLTADALTVVASLLARLNMP